MMNGIRIAALLGMMFFYKDTLAAESTNVSPGIGFLQITAALIFVIALMLFAAWAFRKIGPINSTNKINLKVVGGMSLGHRERIMVVEVGEQWLILGITSANINHLGSLPKQESLPQDKELTGNAFQDWLKRTVDKRNSSHGSSE